MGNTKLDDWGRLPGHEHYDVDPAKLTKAGEIAFELRNLPLRSPAVQEVFDRLHRGEKPPEQKAMRSNSGKPLMHYILHYPRTVELLARILECGEHKYEYMNWKKGNNTDASYLDACLRHLMHFVDGETHDKEYRTHHLGHAIWNLMTMFEFNDHDILVSKEEFDAAIVKLDKLKEERERAKEQHDTPER